jgi:hypothetical protein
VKFEGTAIVGTIDGRWRIASVDRGAGSLRLPSEGGERIASAGLGVWGLAIGISAALMLLVALAIRLTPEPMALPTTKQ